MGYRALSRWSLRAVRFRDRHANDDRTGAAAAAHSGIPLRSRPRRRPRSGGGGGAAGAAPARRCQRFDQSDERAPYAGDDGILPGRPRRRRRHPAGFGRRRARRAKPPRGVDGFWCALWRQGRRQGGTTHDPKNPEARGHEFALCHPRGRRRNRAVVRSPPRRARQEVGAARAHPKRRAAAGRRETEPGGVAAGLLASRGVASAGRRLGPRGRRLRVDLVFAVGSDAAHASSGAMSRWSTTPAPGTGSSR